IDELKAMGFHLVVIVDPGIKKEKGYSAYEDGLKNDVFLKYPDGTNYTGQVWPGWCHFPDFTNPKTRKWWGNSFKGYVNDGIDGFWNDMNEPATWGQRFPDLVEFDFDGHKGTHRKGHNVFGMQMSRSTYDGAKELMNGRRPFILTRATYAGGQRFSAIWTGDNQPTDDHMIAGVRLVNSLGLSGFPYAGMDVGGFAGDASRDLFARWIQIGAFSPFFRGHTMVDSKDKEPWSHGEKDEEISRNFIQLRYNLMPYIYSTFYEATQNGMPVSRSLAFYHTYDNKIYDGNYQNQYYFGHGLLVAPYVSYRDLNKLIMFLNTNT
ncbi:MAG: glycoside hydrolase family 31, partial [Bacteroidetes bacterium]|nr:glycoside hydrolase family 31 [Bacteroidota bacterium]